MKIRCVLFLMMLALPLAVSGQPGRTGLGLRGSFDGAGITAKYFIDRSFAFDWQVNAGGIYLLNGESYYSSFFMLYHLQLPIPFIRIFFGGGFHAGVWKNREEATYTNETIFGLDGVGGVEYMFNRVPIGISGDLRMSVNYLQEVELMPHNAIGVAVRYYFGSNEVKPFLYPKRIRSRFK